jgi:hypothetical protein
VPKIREIWLFLGRASAVVPKKIEEMQIWAEQKRRFYSQSVQGDFILIRKMKGFTTATLIYVKLFISLLIQMEMLRSRQSAVLEARGRFPSEDFLPEGGDAAASSSWFGSTLGDLLLCGLFVTPIVIGNTLLVPSAILTVCQALRSHIL